MRKWMHHKDGVSLWQKFSQRRIVWANTWVGVNHTAHPAGPFDKSQVNNEWNDKQVWNFNNIGLLCHQAHEFNIRYMSTSLI